MVKLAISLGITIIFCLVSTVFGNGSQEMDPRKRQAGATPTATTQDPVSELASYCPDVTSTASLQAYLSCTSSVFQSINLACNPQAADCQCAFTQAFATSCVTSICPKSIAALLTTDMVKCKGGLVTSGLTAVQTSTAGQTTSSGSTASQTSSSNANDHQQHSGVSSGAIAGIAVGAFAAGTALVAGLILLFVKRRRRKSAAPEYDPVAQFLNPTSPLPTTSGYRPGTPPGFQPVAPGFSHHPGQGYAHPRNQTTTPSSGYANTGGYERKMEASSPPPPAVVVTGVPQHDQVYEFSGESTQNRPIFEAPGDDVRRWPG